MRDHSLSATQVAHNALLGSPHGKALKSYAGDIFTLQPHRQTFIHTHCLGNAILCRIKGAVSSHLSNIARCAGELTELIISCISSSGRNVVI